MIHYVIRSSDFIVDSSNFLTQANLPYYGGLPKLFNRNGLTFSCVEKSQFLFNSVTTGLKVSEKYLYNRIGVGLKNEVGRNLRGCGPTYKS